MTPEHHHALLARLAPQLARARVASYGPVLTEEQAIKHRVACRKWAKAHPDYRRKKV